ncbi:hypothetical protein D1BOALGB6SA_2359 [Olavius sp. associated proteobacterium Delta 1]|nr:hypothetical protein D1BOALGB6SA_2359 [Olavius sp. associated proteobacterium Delta 1]
MGAALNPATGGIGNNPPGLIGICCTRNLFFILIRLWRSTDDFLVRKSGRGGVLKYKAQLP